MALSSDQAKKLEVLFKTNKLDPSEFNGLTERQASTLIDDSFSELRADLSRVDDNDSGVRGRRSGATQPEQEDRITQLIDELEGR